MALGLLDRQFTVDASSFGLIMRALVACTATYKGLEEMSTKRYDLSSFLELGYGDSFSGNINNFHR
jgi:hypothetical protein